jgi:hypothetical protein
MPWDLTARNLTVWEAARATSAVPGIFKPIIITRPNPVSPRGRNSFTYIGPGLEHSNPTDLLFTEAIRVYGDRRRVKFILSIGTGNMAHRITNQGNFAPSLAFTAVDITRSCETVHQRLAERFRAHSQVYFRLNLDQGADDAQLQDWEQVDRLSAAIERQLATEPMKTELETLADLLCERDGSPGRKYHTLGDLFGLQSITRSGCSTRLHSIPLLTTLQTAYVDRSYRRYDRSEPA